MNCHPTHCGLELEMVGDRVTAVRGDRAHPESRGFVCVRGQAAPDILDSPERVLEPRARAADGSWQRTSWASALDRIAAAVQDVGLTKTAIYTGHGVRNQLSKRFAHLLGAQWWDPSIVCWGLGGFGFHLTGVTEVNTAEDMAEHAELIVLWGSNLVSQPTTFPKLVAAKRRGARVIAIDVRQTESFALADECYVLRPGSDTALALAMVHVIVAEELFDADFVAAHTVGFEELRRHVSAYTPAWAASETGLTEVEVRSLARAYAATKRAMILAGASSMHKTGNSYHAARAISCLPALTGSLGHAGAGMGPRHAGKSHGFGLGSVVPPDVKRAEDVVPSEMSRILEALETGEVRVLLLLGTNFLSSFADGARVVRALQKLRLVVCFDLFESDTSRELSHLLLPGTTWLEEVGYKLTNTHVYLTDAVATPRGEAKTSAWLLQELATRLGRPDFFPWPSFEGVLDAAFAHDALQHTSVAALRASGGAQRLAVGSVGHADLRFPTPSGKVELVSEQARSLGLSALPEPPPLSESTPGTELAVRFPLVFVQGRSMTHFHSFYDHGRVLPQLSRVDPEPSLWLSAPDAAARSVVEGDAIRLSNERGEMRAVAHVTDRIPAGVVWMHDGWRGINQLTSSARQVSDEVARAFPAGSASYEARVEVMRASC